MLKDSKGLNENIQRKRADIRSQFLIGIERREREEKSPMRRLKRNIIKTAAGIALVSGLTTAGCYISPAFGEMISDIPVLNIFYNLVKEGSSEESAAEHGHGQELDAKYTEGDYEFRFIYGMRDSQKLVLAYEIYEKEKYLKTSMITMDNLTIKDEDGHVWKAYSHIHPYRGKSGEGLMKLRSTDLGFQSNLSKGKEQMDLDMSGIVGSVYMDFDVVKYGDKKRNTLIKVRDMEIPIGKLNKSFGYRIDTQEEFKIGKNDIVLSSITVEPTEMKVKFQWNSEDEKFIIDHFRGFYFDIEDDKGKSYSKDQGIAESLSFAHREFKDENWKEKTENIGVKRFKFECVQNSPYYEEIEFLKISNIGIVENYEESMEIDLKNEKIIYCDTDRITLGKIHRKEEYIMIELLTDDFLLGAKNIRSSVGDNNHEEEIMGGITKEELFIKEKEGCEKLVIARDKGDVNRIKFDYTRIHKNTEELFEDEIIIPMSEKKYLREEVKEGN